MAELARDRESEGTGTIESPAVDILPAMER